MSMKPDSFVPSDNPSMTCASMLMPAVSGLVESVRVPDRSRDPLLRSGNSSRTRSTFDGIGPDA